MLQAIWLFISYFGTAVVLLALFVALYSKFTPYQEFKLIKENNSAAAITLSGAMLGFTFPLVSSIYYTQSLGETALWAVVTGCVQLTVFSVIRRWATQIENNQVAPAILVASGSISVGLLNAACISY